MNILSNKKAVNAIWTILLGFSIPLSAQDDVSRELTLEKEYNPIVEEASKINELPEIKEPEAPKNQVRYSDYTIPYNVQPQVVHMQPGSYFTEMLKSDKRGYLNLGLGTFFDLNMDAGYRILDKASDQLSVYVSNRTSNGKVKYPEYLEEDIKQTMKLMDTKLGMSYKHHFSAMEVYADINYLHSTFNYFGYSPLLAERKTNPLLERKLDIDKSQANNIINTRAGLFSKPGQDIQYLLNIDYSYFGQKESLIPEYPEYDGASEQYFRMDFGVSKGFRSNSRLGISGYFRNSSFEKQIPFQDNIDVDYTNLGFNPYLKIDEGNWSARLGIWVHYLFNDYAPVFMASPDLEFSFRPSENWLIYILATGEVKDNSNKSIFAENRYVHPNIRIMDSRTPLDATFGIRTSIVSGLGLDLFTGYKITKDEHFYCPDFVTTNIGGNFSSPIYQDATTFKIGAQLKYKHSNQFDVSWKSTIYSWGVEDNTEEAWNKPQFESDFVFGWNIPDQPLRFETNYHLETGRKRPEINFFELGTSKYKQKGTMKNIHELNAQVVYTLDDTFSFFLRSNNLLFQQYELLVGYPVQGFNVIGGVNIKF